MSTQLFKRIEKSTKDRMCAHKNTHVGKQILQNPHRLEKKIWAVRRKNREDGQERWGEGRRESGLAESIFTGCFCSDLAYLVLPPVLSLMLFIWCSKESFSIWASASAILVLDSSSFKHSFSSISICTHRVHNVYLEVWALNLMHFVIG